MFLNSDSVCLCCWPYFLCASSVFSCVFLLFYFFGCFLSFVSIFWQWSAFSIFSVCFFLFHVFKVSVCSGVCVCVCLWIISYDALLSPPPVITTINIGKSWTFWRKSGARRDRFVVTKSHGGKMCSTYCWLFLKNKSKFNSNVNQTLKLTLTMARWQFQRLPWRWDTR